MKTQRGLLVFLVLVSAYFARTVFVPLFLAVFLAILLEPFVRVMMRWRIGRAEASIVVTVTFLLLAGAAGWTIYRSISGIASEMPTYAERIRGLIAGMHSTTELIAESTRRLGLGDYSTQADIQQVQVVESIPAWMQYLAGWMGSLYDLVSVALFVPLLLLYVLFEKENLLESFNAVAGRYFYLPKLNSELPKIIRAFVRANIFTGLLLIGVHSLLFRGVKLENWVPLAILSGVLNLVPLIGAPLALVLPFAQAVVQFRTAGPYVIIGSGVIVSHLVSNNVVLPFFMSSRVNVNSVTLVFGLLFWGWLWGPVGFLLAIPMTALVKTLLESNSETYVFSNLFAARPRHLIPWAKRRATASAGSHADDFKTVDVDEASIREFQRRNNRETEEREL